MDRIIDFLLTIMVFFAMILFGTVTFMIVRDLITGAV